jgi:hypothetical protein
LGLQQISEIVAVKPVTLIALVKAAGPNGAPNQSIEQIGGLLPTSTHCSKQTPKISKRKMD